MIRYIKTFSRRDVLSALFSALMLSSVIAISYFVSLIHLPKIFFLLTKILFFCFYFLSILLSHRFYLLEHKRRNRFWGRICHDFLISFFLFLILVIILNIINRFYSIGCYSNAIMAVLVVVLSIEIVLSIFNLIFRRLKWQIW